MKRLMMMAGLAGGVAFAQPALAEPPPADAMPLSEIIAQLEESEDLSYFKEIEWDDNGYWEIEIRRADGAKLEIEIDPVSGQPRTAAN